MLDKELAQVSHNVNEALQECGHNEDVKMRLVFIGHRINSIRDSFGVRAR